MLKKIFSGKLTMTEILDLLNPIRLAAEGANPTAKPKLRRRKENRKPVEEYVEKSINLRVGDTAKIQPKQNAQAKLKDFGSSLFGGKGKGDKAGDEDQNLKTSAESGGAGKSGEEGGEGAEGEKKVEKTEDKSEEKKEESGESDAPAPESVPKKPSAGLKGITGGVGGGLKNVAGGVTGGLKGIGSGLSSGFGIGR